MLHMSFLSKIKKILSALVVLIGAIMYLRTMFAREERNKEEYLE